MDFGNNRDISNRLYAFSRRNVCNSRCAYNSRYAYNRRYAYNSRCVFKNNDNSHVKGISKIGETCSSRAACNGL